MIRNIKITCAPPAKTFQLSDGKVARLTVKQLIWVTSTPCPVAFDILFPLGCLLKNCFLSLMSPRLRGFISCRTLSSGGGVPPYFHTKENSHLSATATPRCLEPPSPLDLKVTSGLTHVSNWENNTKVHHLWINLLHFYIAVHCCTTLYTNVMCLKHPTRVSIAVR